MHLQWPEQVKHGKAQHYDIHSPNSLDYVNVLKSVMASKLLLLSRQYKAAWSSLLSPFHLCQFIPL